MARPEDTLARGAGRNAGGFEPEPAYDDGLQGQRRSDPRLADPRTRNDAPMRGPNQSGIPLAPDPQREVPRGAAPGVTPRFDPYLPQGNPAPPRQQAGDPRTYAEPRQNGRQDPRLDFPPQAQPVYAADPYLTQRAPQGAAPNGQRPQQPPAGPPVGGRYAGPERGAPVSQGTQGRPGQTQRSPASRQDIVPPVRSGEPQFAGQVASPDKRPNGTRQPYGYAQDGYGQDPYSGAEAGAEDDDFESDDADADYADEARPRSRRGLYVIGALVVAIAIGGGLGYAYKLSMGSGGKGGAPHVVQADKAPTKSVPADAGGQTFDTSKKTILDRAGETPDGAATVVSNLEQVATSTQGSANGQTDAIAVPRKVPTVVVKPGQPIEAAAPVGVTVDDQGVPGISLGEPDPQPAVKPAPKVPDAAALKAKMKAATKPAAAAVAQQAADGADQAGVAGVDAAGEAQAAAAQQPTKLAGAKIATAKKAVKVAVADPAPDAGADLPADQADPAATAPAPAAKTKVASANAAATAPAKASSGGYILQVYSGKSQAESLAYFADMQQKFGDLLGSGQPDIQEVDLGAQGVKFRLRIGPPGSSAAVKSLCSKLKASGLKDCITAAY